jgi:transposase
MKKNTKAQTALLKRKLSDCPTGSFVGLDIGDRWTHAAVFAGDELLVEDRIESREPAIRRWLTKLRGCVVAMEVGTHSRWMWKVAVECGHEALVANPRRVRLIYADTNKHDRLDAKKLARLARYDRTLLNPVIHRPEQEQADLAWIAVREKLVEMRTEAVNLVRGMVKAAGGRIGTCSTEAFPEKAKDQIPEVLQGVMAPMLEQIQEFSGRIRECERTIAVITKERYPEVELLMQVDGVGLVTALAFRLTISNALRFEQSRDVGCYVGLRPRRKQSGESDPQLGITKEGNERLRRLLVNCAHYILGPFGKDSDLRRWGLNYIENSREGRKPGAKKRAVVAVARKLAVLLHRLWVGGEVYEPLRNAGVKPAAV